MFHCFTQAFIVVLSVTIHGVVSYQNIKCTNTAKGLSLYANRYYPINNPSNSYKNIYNAEQQIKKLNSNNVTQQIKELNEILANEILSNEERLEKMNKLFEGIGVKKNLKSNIEIKLNRLYFPLIIKEIQQGSKNKIIDDNKRQYQENRYQKNDDNDQDYHDDEDDDDDDDDFMKTDYERNKNKYDIDENDEFDIYGRSKKDRFRMVLEKMKSSKKKTYKKTDNFEMNSGSSITFKDIGGYDNIKKELEQCIDIISNYTKYAKYNVRIPKGLIFEGPPGNGKTLFAKALAGESNTNFISVSGSQFQDKYVGVGSSRVRELFEFSRQNVPCIIFIDEIDAVGRKRSGDDASSGERDNTLNELLISLDGFKQTAGIFVIGATNRADLLDPALVRPGRIDKRIFINNPDRVTRKSIIEIHSSGKPYDISITVENLIEQTNGLSGAQIENLLNEAMLNALKEERYVFNNHDIDVIMNKMIAGWQPNDHQLTKPLIDQIAIHELGHAVVGMVCKHHSKMTKVIINLSSPRSPAYTIFENSPNNFLTREYLFEHLMVLLSGRIAEETFYDISVTTGAINDFEEALKLAEKMVCYYGMGKNIIYPSLSDKYKEIIDLEVSTLIHEAYQQAEFVIHNFKELIIEGSEILKQEKVLTSETLMEVINMKYRHLYENMANIKFCK